MERWLPVLGYEGYYEVSDQGGIRSVDRTIVTVLGVTQRKRGRNIAGELDHGGHVRVQLCRGGKKRRVFVHVLILEAFVGPCPTGYEGCHGNGVPGDNHLINLQWGTKAHNARDRVAHGRDHHARRGRCDRGHRLGGLNVTNQARARGHRTCLACSRGRAYWRLRPDLDLQELVDWYYAEILKAS